MRPATASDARRNSIVHVDTWRTAYRGLVPDTHLGNLSYDETERLWQGVIAENEGCVFVAENDRGIFGFASGHPRRRFSRDQREYEAELKTVYVLPSHQGTGAGRQLVGAVARHFESRGVNSMLLWAFAENRLARLFYESLGSVLVAEDGFELGGGWLSEVAYGWEELRALLSGGAIGRPSSWEPLRAS